MPARPAAELRKDLLAASGLFLFCFALYLLPAVLRRPLSETPELRVAVTARTMVQSGEYIVPRMAEEARLNKPPLPYWLTAGAARMLGVTPESSAAIGGMTRATLLVSATFTALTVFVLALFASVVFGRAAGLMAGLFYGLSLAALNFGQMGFSDTTLAFFCAAAVCAAAWLAAHPKPGVLTALALGVSLGLGILTKGHVPLVLLLPALLATALIERSFSGRKTGLAVLALALAALLAVPWFLAVAAREPEAVAVLQREFNEGLNPSDAHRQSDRWFFYLYNLLALAQPWALLLCAAGAAALLLPRRFMPPPGAQEQFVWRVLRFALLVFVLGFLAFYASPKQQRHYLLPLLPALALFGGGLLGRFCTAGGEREERLAWLTVALGAVIAAAIAGAPWIVPALIDTGVPSNAAFAAQLGEPAAIGIAVAVALGLLVLHLYAARQIVEGRPAAAVAALAIAAYASWTGVTLYSVQRQKDDMYEWVHEGERLRKELAALPPAARVYVFNMNDACGMFYLNRNVHSLGDLQKEASGVTGNDAPVRVLLTDRFRLDKQKRGDPQILKEQFGIEVPPMLVEVPPGERVPRLQLVELPRDRDWPVEIRKGLEALRAERRAGNRADN